MNEDVKQYLTNTLTDVEQIAAFQLQQSVIIKDLRRYFELFITLAKHSEDEAHALVGEEKQMLEDIINELPTYNVSGSVTLSLPSGFPITLRTLKSVTNVDIQSLDSTGRWNTVFTYYLDASQRPGYIEMGGAGFDTMSKNEAGQTIKMSWLQVCDELSQTIKLNETMSTVLDMVDSGKAQLADLYKVVETKVGVLSGSTKDFMLGLSSYGSTLNRSSVLSIIKSMAQSISGVHVDESTQSLVLADTKFSNRANLGMIIKTAITTVAQVAASIAVNFISPIAAAIGFGVGKVASFIGQSIDKIDSYRVDYEALLYDYGHTLGTFYAPIPSWYNLHKESFMKYGSTVFHCGPLYVYAIPHFFNNAYDETREDPVDYLQFQLRANLSYVPNSTFTLGSAVPGVQPEELYFDRATIPYVTVSLADVSEQYQKIAVAIEITDPDAVLVHENMAANFHSSYITQGSIKSEDEVISQLCLTMASVGALLVKSDEFGPIASETAADFFKGSVFKASNTINITNFAKMIGWFVAYGSSGGNGHKFYYNTPSGGKSYTVMDFKWSYLTDFFIPWFRELATQDDRDRGYYLLLHALGYVTDTGAVNLPAVLEGPCFMLPPSVSKEQVVSSALVVAGLSVAAALVAVGAVKVKSSINKLRVKRYAEVQRKLQAYTNSGSQEDLNTYVKAVKSYNRWAPIFGSAKLEMTSGYETSGSSSTDSIDEIEVMKELGEYVNDQNSTLAYTSTDQDVNANSYEIINQIRSRLG